MDVEIGDLLGVYSHMWDRSAQSEEVSRHTVNVVYRATPTADDPDVALDDQHADFRWIDEPEPDLHEYVRRYMADLWE